MARAGGALPRPGEGLLEGRERAGARARAEAAPGAETLQAGDRKAHLEARAAGEIAGTASGQRTAGRSCLHSQPGSEAEPDASRDRETRGLVAQELARFEVAKFEEQRRDATDAVSHTAPHIPGELGPLRVGSDVAGLGRKLDV